MFDYTNSLSEKFRLSINKLNKKNDGDKAPTVQYRPASSASLSSVTPDYNVVLPQGYTKLGVQTLRNGQ